MKIRVFSTPTCPYCVALELFLQEKEVEFEHVDISVDIASQKEMVAKTNQMGVPVIQIDEEWLVGFDKERILKLLGI